MTMTRIEDNYENDDYNNGFETWGCINDKNVLPTYPTGRDGQQAMLWHCEGWNWGGACPVRSRKYHDLFMVWRIIWSFMVSGQ